MYSISWYIAVFVSFPEAFLVTMLGYKLFNIDVDRTGLSLVSTIYAVISFIVRGLPIPFGIHTGILIVALIILGKKILKRQWLESSIAILTGMLIMGVLQSILIPFSLMILDKGIEDLYTYTWLNIVVFMPCIFIILLLYTFVKKKAFYIYDINGINNHA